MPEKRTTGATGDLGHDVEAAGASRTPSRDPGGPAERTGPGETENASEPVLDVAADLSAGNAPADVEDESPTAEEIALYRRRIADGFYNSREVADEVARRMKERGDV